MSMRFRRECGKDILEEALPLLRLHYEEIAHHKDIPLDPDFEQYKKLEDLGLLRIFTARDEESVLVGYAVFFVRPNPHYSSSLQAVQDVLFVHPKKRGFGARFILWCDKELEREGVQVVYHHVKARHNFGAMLERMGYELIDLIYGRRLK